MEEGKTSLRFGVMVDDMTLQRWQAETIKKLTDSGMQLLLIIKNEESAPKKGLFRKIKEYPFRRMFFQVWNHRLFKPECKAMVDLSAYCELEKIEVLNCQPQHQGISTIISNNDIETIRNQELDFILRFGFNILSGEILTVAKYGIWSFHHDDEMVYRGAPPGFWEFMHDDPVNGIILQKLTESLDKGVILKKVFYPTILHSYKAHLNQLYFESESLPLEVCNEIIRTGGVFEYESKSTAPVYRAPKNGKMLKYWLLCPIRRLRFHLHDLFRQEDWDVAYAEIPLREFIKDPKSYESDFVWFRRSHLNTYYADPFVISTAKDTYIFFESYNYKKGKGSICVALKSEKFKKHHEALYEPFHLSYPFVFQYNGTVYCLPEANESNRLTLYRFNEKELILEKDSVLMENIRAIDPTLYFKDGKWNLFLGLQKYSNIKLFRYLSNDLRGPYETYYNNPIKTDCQNARMAGAFFTDGDTLIRPGQESIRYYGTAVRLNEVQVLSDDYYSESQIIRIEPFNECHFKHGLHTLNGNETMTVIDGKRFFFTFSGLFHQLKLKVKR